MFSYLFVSFLISFTYSTRPLGVTTQGPAISLTLTVKGLPAPKEIGIKIKLLYVCLSVTFAILSPTMRSVCQQDQQCPSQTNFVAANCCNFGSHGPSVGSCLFHLTIIFCSFEVRSAVSCCGPVAANFCNFEHHGLSVRKLAFAVDSHLLQF